MADATFADFERLVVTDFPELKELFEDNSDLPYMRVGSLAQVMQRAKGAGDWDAYRRAVRVVDELFRNPDKELWNALHVSLLENIDFGGPRGKDAWAMLTPRLQAGWRDI